VRKILASLFLLMGLSNLVPLCAAKKVVHFNPYENDRLYVGFSFGSRLVDKRDLSSDIPGIKFSTDNQWKLAEQLLMGYDLCDYFGFEWQITFFPSSVYYLSPNSDSINRKIYTFSILGKVIIPLERVHFYFGAGAATVYTLAPNFEAFVPEGPFRPSTGDEYIDAKWGRKGFFRPKVMIGFGVYFSKRVLVSLAYSEIFGVGNFGARGVIYTDREPEFHVNEHYLPNLKLLVIKFTVKV